MNDRQNTNENVSQSQETQKPSHSPYPIIAYLEQVVEKVQEDTHNPNAHIGHAFDSATRPFNNVFYVIKTNELNNVIKTGPLDNLFSILAETFAEKIFSTEQLSEQVVFEKLKSIIDENFKPVVEGPGWKDFWNKQLDFISQDADILAIQDTMERETAIQKKANIIKNQIAAAFTSRIQSECSKINESIKQHKSWLKFIIGISCLCHGRNPVVAYLEQVVKKVQDNTNNPNAHIGYAFYSTGRPFNREFFAVKTDILDNDFSMLAETFPEKFFSIEQVRDDFQKIQSIVVEYFILTMEVDEYFKSILDGSSWKNFWDKQLELINLDPKMPLPSIIKNQVAGAYTFRIQSDCALNNDSVKYHKNLHVFTMALTGLCNGEEFASLTERIVTKCDREFSNAVSRMETAIVQATKKSSDDLIAFVKDQINALRSSQYFPGEIIFQEQLRALFKKFKATNSVSKFNRRFVADAIILDLYDNLGLVQQMNEKLDESPHLRRTIAEIESRTSKFFKNKKVTEFLHLWNNYKEGKAPAAKTSTKQQPQKVTQPANANSNVKPSKPIATLTHTNSFYSSSKAIATPTSSGHKPSKSITTSSVFNDASLSHGVIPDIFLKKEHTKTKWSESAMTHGEIPSMFLNNNNNNNNNTLLTENAVSHGAIPDIFLKKENKKTPMPEKKEPTQAKKQ